MKLKIINRPWADFEIIVINVIIRTNDTYNKLLILRR